MSARTPESNTSGYVGQIIDPDWSPEEQLAMPVSVPDHPAYSPFPGPGIHFGMPEDEYHRINACSTSELKRMSVSSMEAWAYSRRNPDYEEQASKFFDYGKAVHCLVLEGREAYERRYAVELDASDFEDALVSTEDIRAAISRFRETAPVEPRGTTKQELVDQLRDLGQRHGRAVNTEGTLAELRARIREFSEERPVAPITRVEVIEDGVRRIRPAAKRDLIDQLMRLDPNARVWDRILADHLAANEGKIMITARDDRRVRVAAQMIERHPDASKLLKGGHAEVSLFWYCPRTGAPMKARVDYLRLSAIIDLKTFSNKTGKPIDRAIEHTIATYRYNLQHCIYDEAVREVRKVLRAQGETAIHSHDAPDRHAERVDWAMRWANQNDPPAFIFIFLQSGLAPVTRVKVMPRQFVFSVTNAQAERLKRAWIECVQTYGNDPWLDLQPMSEIEDEAIPEWATELGRDGCE
jgi:hypothetical protein